MFWQSQIDLLRWFKSDNNHLGPVSVPNGAQGQTLTSLPSLLLTYEVWVYLYGYIKEIKTK